MRQQWISRRRWGRVWKPWWRGRGDVKTNQSSVNNTFKAAYFKKPLKILYKTNGIWKDTNPSNSLMKRVHPTAKGITKRLSISLDMQAVWNWKVWCGGAVKFIMIVIAYQGHMVSMIYSYWCSTPGNGMRYQLNFLNSHSLTWIVG